jgi:hypothetical protein
LSLLSFFQNIIFLNKKGFFKARKSAIEDLKKILKIYEIDWLWQIKGGGGYENNIRKNSGEIPGKVQNLQGIYRKVQWENTRRLQQSKL